MNLPWLAPALAIATIALAACGEGDPQSTSSAAGPGGSGGAAASTTGSTTSGSTSSGGGSGGAGSSAIPGGGVILFEEPFDDTNFQDRGWYDGSSGSLSTTEHIPSSASSFECAFDVGASSCKGGKPARHKFPPSDSVYLSFHIKFSPNWVGSGKPYHPHMFHFINDIDNDYVGPSHTFLTTYTEVVEGAAFLALQDSKNVDLACILKNDDTFMGCNGDFATYKFTEDRSACACNGLAGYLDGRDCFPNGDGTWYSSRSWRSNDAFQDSPGPTYKSDWHFVEVYFEMNSIQNGVALPDGKIRWIQDGAPLITSDAILMRTGAHPTMTFTQFAMLPYIGDGSPLAQSFWIDDLTVATARP
jgi:hypothetical protein